MNYSYRKYPKIGGSKISGRQDPRQSHHLPQLVLGTQEIGGWKPQMLKNWRKTVMKTVSDFADWYDWNWKKKHVRLYDWDYVEKTPMFFQFFPHQTMIEKLWDYPVEIKAKDADGETVEGHGVFSWWFCHGHSSHNMKIVAEISEIVLFFYQLSHKITWISVLFCPIIWKCL
jgi:hypothetical protein